jgi:hypothetical protein
MYLPSNHHLASEDILLGKSLHISQF